VLRCVEKRKLEGRVGLAWVGLGSYLWKLVSRYLRREVQALEPGVKRRGACSRGTGGSQQGPGAAQGLPVSCFFSRSEAPS
jgi:hypothetical protein